MGLFGGKKEKQEKTTFFNQNNDVSSFVPGQFTTNNGVNQNSTVLAPQPQIVPETEVLETNIQAQNQTYQAGQVAPLGVSGPVAQPAPQPVQPAPVQQPVQQVAPQPAPQATQPQVAANQAQAQAVPAVTTPPDALNNATNEVPVNPVAPVEEKKDYSENRIKPKTIIPFIINSVIKPGTTMEKEGDIYRDNVVALEITLYLTIMTLLGRIASGILNGFFVKNYNPITGMTTTSFSPGNLMSIDWLGIFVTSVMSSGIAILIVSGVYALSSFIKSKGIKYGRYLIVTNIAFVPFLIAFSLLGPVVSIASTFLGFVIVFIGVIFTFISFISGINNLLKIDSVNKNIIYNVINIGAIFSVVLFLIYHFMYAEIVNAIGMIH